MTISLYTTTQKFGFGKCGKQGGAESPGNRTRLVPRVIMSVGREVLSLYLRFRVFIYFKSRGYVERLLVPASFFPELERCYKI